MPQRIPPGRRMEQEIFDGMAASADPLGEAARRGAQLILHRALEMEVEDFLGRGHYERSTAPNCRGWRNGYEPKKVQTAEGSIEIQVPQIRDSLEPFESIWLKAIGKRSKRLLDLVPMLYVKGMSQRDIEAALVEALGVEQTGRSVVNEVCRTLRADFERWQDRDMSEFELMYLFLDGIWLKMRPEDKRAVLCAYGILLDGRKVLLHLAVGDKESAACWEAFPAAMKCLARDIEECLTALKFPFIHRRQIRTTNLLERLFGEGRRRTKVIPRLRSEASALSLIFAVLVDAPRIGLEPII